MVGPSVIEQMLVQVQALLLGATSAGQNVTRGRADPFSREELPAINVRRAPSTHEPQGQGRDRVTAMFDVDIEVRGDDWETQADALHASVDELLTQSPVLAGLVSGLRCISTDAQAEGGDDTAGRITARYQAQLLQRRG